MELHTIDQKPFRQNFLQTIIPMAVAVVGSLLLINNGYIILNNFDPSRRFTWPIMITMLALAFCYSYYRKKQLEKVFDVENFDDQVKAYENVYKLTMRWYLLSCMVSCFLAVLTARNIFLYFAGYDFIMMLPYYPNKLLFRRELRNDEIILHQ